MRSVCVFLAPGYEPLEALAPFDILKRANLDVRFVSLTDSLEVKSTMGVSFIADSTLKDFLESVDESQNDGCMIFPGGLPGADNLGAEKRLMEILRRHFTEGGLVAAICAAPARVLAANLAEMAKGRRMTVYAGFENELEAKGIIATGAKVERDGNLITAKGPGVAIDFGLAILEAMVDPRIFNVVKKAMML